MASPLIYGGVVALAVFFVGWSTGMGGALLPNLIFSVAVGALAAACMALLLRWSGRRDEADDG